VLWDDLKRGCWFVCFGQVDGFLLSLGQVLGVAAPDHDFAVEMDTKGIKDSLLDERHEFDDIAGLAGMLVVDGQKVGVLHAHGCGVFAQALASGTVYEQTSGDTLPHLAQQLGLMRDILGKGGVLEAAARAMSTHGLAGAFDSVDLLLALLERGDIANRQPKVCTSNKQMIQARMAIVEVYLGAFEDDLATGTIQGEDTLNRVSDLAIGAARVHDNRAAQGGWHARDILESFETSADSLIYEFEEVHASAGVDERTPVHALANLHARKLGIWRGERYYKIVDAVIIHQQIGTIAQHTEIRINREQVGQFAGRGGFGKSRRAAANAKPGLDRSIVEEMGGDRGHEASQQCKYKLLNDAE